VGRKLTLQQQIVPETITKANMLDFSKDALQLLIENYQEIYKPPVLCFDLMEMVGEKVEKIRIMKKLHEELLSKNEIYVEEINGYECTIGYNEGSNVLDENFQRDFDARTYENCYFGTCSKPAPSLGLREICWNEKPPNCSQKEFDRLTWNDGWSGYTPDFWSLEFWAQKNQHQNSPGNFETSALYPEYGEDGVDYD